MQRPSQAPICEHAPADRQRLFPARDYVTGDQFEIYNPWGYTYWVGEDAFSSGDIAAAKV